MDVSFIIGSPRSGTTILGQILDQHPQIAQWYEPYFIWDYYIGNKDTDIRTSKELTPKIKHFIRHEFEVYHRKSKKNVIVDKSPEHSFKIPFIFEIFPDAKWIHILRDGRDATLSIHKEWERRRKIVENRDYLSLIKLALTMLQRQPFPRHKWKALCFEIKNSSSLNPKKYLNKSKWKGQLGWGPRFEGWEEVLNTHSVIEFNAHQWLHCVMQINQDLPKLPPEKVLEVRYEHLVSYPEEVLKNIIEFLGLSFSDSFIQKMPSINLGNFSKWRREFSREQLLRIAPILTPKLIELGYERDGNWITSK
jgi:hypothetical protein